MEWKPERLVNSVKDDASQEFFRLSASGFLDRLAASTSSDAALEKAANEEYLAEEQIADHLLIFSNATIFLHINKAKVKTAVSSHFGSELEGPTRAPPPKYTTPLLIGVSGDEHVASTSKTDTSSETKSLRCILLSL